MIKAAINATITVVGLFIILAFIVVSIVALETLFGSDVTLFLGAVTVVWVIAFIMYLEER